MTTLKDIAREAGVNVSTVSRALKGDTEIAEATRQRINDIAFRLGYHPKKKEDKTYTVGIIIPDMISDFFTNILVEFDCELSKIGYTPLYTPFFFDDDSCKKALDICRMRCVEGIFIVCAPLKMSDYIKKYVAYNHLPIIALMPAPNYFSFMDSVRIDIVPALEEAIWILKQKGHKKIGVMTDEMNYGFRRGEFKEAFCANEIDEKEIPVYLNKERFERGGYLAMKGALKEKDHPTAFLMGYDQYAIGAYRAICEAGLAIPEDIAICSIDNISMASYLTPSLSSIAFPVKEAVELSVNYMVKALDDEQKEKAIHRTTLNSKLMIRESM